MSLEDVSLKSWEGATVYPSPLHLYYNIS